MTTSTSALPMRDNHPTFTGRHTGRSACNLRKKAAEERFAVCFAAINSNNNRRRKQIDPILAICILLNKTSCKDERQLKMVYKSDVSLHPKQNRCCCCQRQSKLYSGQNASRTKQQTTLRNTNCCCVYCPKHNLDESEAAVAHHVSRASHSRLHILHPFSQRQPAPLQQGFVVPSRVRSSALAVRQRGRLSV